MTSSLVGSEMCIRDSRGQRATDLPDRRCARESRSGSLGKILRAHAQCACLLYTSDAADDM
eukprot:10750288-Prorocentrum_lima.AAC.1